MIDTALSGETGDFTVKSLEEIYQALAAQFQERTGLTAGGSGDLAVRFYAVAAQLYGLYAQADWVCRQCFPQTASGEMLDRHGQLRGISRRQAGKAGGVVRFFAGEERTQPAEIAAGTVCMTAEGRRYVTTQAGSIPVGETQTDLEVEAAEAGAAWNVPAGRIIYLALPPSGIIACSNPEALTGGTDSEEDESLRQRIMETYSRLANGANAAFYEQNAMSFDEVAAVKVLPRNRGLGTVDVVAAAQGGMPDETLLAALQSRFDSVREIAVDVKVLAPTRADAEITVALSMESGYRFDQVSEQVRRTLENWFDGKLLGRPVLQAALTALVFAVDGVSNCVVTLTGGDMAADSVTLPCLGQLTVTQTQEGGTA